MIDLSTEEWREALARVQALAEDPTNEDKRISAFDFFRTAQSKRLLSLAHLLQPGATPRTIQAALVPLERVDKRSKITDMDMGIRTTDTPCVADRAPFVLVADNVRSAFNMGGIFRTADFFGAEEVVLCGYSPTPENPHVAKTALGATDSTPWRTAPDVRDVIDSFRAKAYRIYALETVNGASPIGSVKFVFPCVLLLGNERFGLDPDVIAMSDEVVEIRSHGLKNSLNVVSACAVAAAFVREQIEDAPHGFYR